ncbi:hypothetical protein [Streptomyces prunicolor]|uniref:hypothetical protein n=1 Tax=Streptomyces prunicolor TaxID=67348 RepID=UPI00344A3775
MTQGHDALPQPSPPAPGVLRIRVDSTFGAMEEVKLRVSPELAQPLLAQLQEDGSDASFGAEFSLDLGELTIIAVMMRDSGAWMTLRTAIEKYADRHKGKQVRLEHGNSVVDIQGYGAKDVERLMKTAHDDFTEHARKWQEMNQRMGPPPDGDSEG